MLLHVRLSDARTFDVHLPHASAGTSASTSASGSQGASATDSDSASHSGSGSGGGGGGDGSGIGALTVKDLKAAIADVVQPRVEPEQQKIVYKGRILKDEDTLLSYGTSRYRVKRCCCQQRRHVRGRRVHDGVTSVASIWMSHPAGISRLHNQLHHD